MKQEARSRLARASMRLNAWRGGKFPHLTICAELWVLDRRLAYRTIDLILLVVFFERDHCKRQYLTYGKRSSKLE